MTEQQFNDLMAMLADMRDDTTLLRSDLAGLHSSVEALAVTNLSSTYAFTTSVGSADVRIEHTATAGDLVVGLLLICVLTLTLLRSAFNGVRGIGV